MLSRRHIPFRSTLLILLVLVILATLVGSVFWHFSHSGVTGKQLTGTPTASANSPPPLYLGLDAYRHWDKLSYLEFGDRVEGQSTADLAGSNVDNIHYLRVLPDGEHVLFDQVGPGLVTFMRMQEH